MNSNDNEKFIYQMPVINGCLDNRSMMNIKCDACGVHIIKTDMIVCTPNGDDFHIECAEQRFKDKTKFANMRKITYAQRMEEYMQQRFNNGESQKDLNNIVSALNKSFPEYNVFDEL
tara:strand:+ start:1278 stop:1628 length:351 start_codon:yes stop_codon:yes gene_type:complete